MNPTRARPVVTLLLLLAAGCGGHRLYSGPRRPRAEVARIELRGTYVAQPEPGIQFYAVEAATVDGTKLERPRELLEVLPGRHSFEIRWSRNEFTDWGDYETNNDSVLVETSRKRGTAKLELDAAPGKSYVLAWTNDADPPARFVAREE